MFGPGVETILQDCSQPWQIWIPPRCCFHEQVLRHPRQENALRRTLREALRCLKNGGHILVWPNIRFLHGAYWDFSDSIPPSQRSFDD